MIHWLPALMLLIFFQGVAMGESSNLVNSPTPIPPPNHPPLDEEPDRVIAVAFGYQKGATSAIRIRTYDAQSGDMLSEDSFDLKVVGGDSSAPEVDSDRVFAGALTLGPAGLADFPMRAYDALSGRFLWRGHLNFVDVGSEDPHRRVHDQPEKSSKATVARLVSTQVPSEIESHFLVQAVETESGKAIWQQAFQSDPPMVEASAGERDATPDSGGTKARDYEIVVQSYERESGKLVWSDRLSTRDQAGEMADERGDQPQLLPVFPIRGEFDKVWVREPRWNRAESHRRT